MICPRCGECVEAKAPVTLDEVKRATEDLPLDDRASLRPWLLATFDVRGYRERVR